jgi:predicted nucleic acid-binding protein
MPVLLDAYAVISVLRGEPAADVIGPRLAAGDAVLHPLNAGEVIDRVARMATVEADEVEGDLALLGVAFANVDPRDLVEAGHWRARHYHRTRRPVSLADCVAAVCALRSEMALATSDRHCAAMLRDEGGEVLALPASDGSLP